MEYQYIRSFIQVGRSLNFTSAAKSLSLTQAAISRQIKLLEESLGEQLVIRSPQSVRLTPRGIQLFDMWEKFENQLDIDFFNKKKRVLKIGTIEGGVSRLLSTPFLKKCETLGENLQIYIRSTAQLLQMLENSQLDFVVCLNKIDNGILTSSELFSERRVLISSQKFPNLDHAKKIYNFVKTSSLIAYSQTDEIMKFHEGATPYIQVNSYEEIIKLVQGGFGVALVPTHVLKESHQLYTIDWPNGKSKLYLVSLNFNKLSPQLSESLQNIKKAFSLVND